MNRTIIPQSVTVIPQQAPQPAQLGINLTELMSLMMNMMIIMMMMKMMASAMKSVGEPAKPKPKPLYPGGPLPGEFQRQPEPKRPLPGELPPGYTAVPRAKEVTKPAEEPKPLKAARKEEAVVEELETKRMRLEAIGREIAEQAGENIRFVELDSGWQERYSVTRYWFEDTRGNRMIASDLPELKWKLGIAGK